MRGRAVYPLALAAAAAALWLNKPAAAPAALTPHCDAMTALAAAGSSAIPSRFQKAWPSFPGFRSLGYGTQTVLCRRDLMSTGAVGMVALYRCCTVSSPTVVGVFEADGSSWRLVYSLVRRLVWHITLRGGELIEKTPVYSFPKDGNCCPSHYRFYRLRWTGQGFETITGRLVHS
jgi:hypothetical protein